MLSKIKRFYWSADDPSLCKATFVNRDELCSIINNEIEIYLQSESYKNKLLVYGQKGIGKTRLLDFAHDQASKHGDFSIVQIYNPHGGNPLLSEVRNQIAKQCKLFDYAKSKLDPLTGYVIRQKKKNRTKLATFLWFGIPGLVTESYYFLQDFLKPLIPINRYYREEFQRIDKANKVAGKLQYLLPTILSEDINKLTETGNSKFIFLIDIQDTRLEYSASKKWLWELVNNLKGGLVIIATQENSKLDVELDCIHVVPRLDDNYVEEMLDSNEINDIDVRKTILKSSSGIPLEVNRRIEKYFEIIKNGGPVDLKILASSLKEIALDSLNNMQESFRKLIQLISIFKIFNINIYLEICRTFDIQGSAESFNSFLTCTLIEKCDDSEEVYQLSSHYWGYGFEADMSQGYKINAINIYAKNFQRNILETFKKDLLVKVYKNSLQLEINHDGQSQLLMTSCLDAAYVLYNRGFWFEMLEEAQVFDGTALENSSLCRFINGHALRKIDSSVAAEKCLSKISDGTLHNSDYQQTAMAELNYVQCLKGQYNKAFLGFKKDYEWVETNNKDANDPRFFKLYLNYVDILFLKGDFVKSAALTELLKSKVDQDRGAEYIEAVRTLGHIFRFNLMYTEAEEQYLKAKEYAKNNDALLAKLGTNLIETFALSRPSLAIKGGEEALEANRNLGAVLEVGKVHAALAIAYIMKGEHEKALNAIKQAKSVQTNARYPAGLLFALRAEFLFYSSTRDVRRKEVVAKKMLDMITRLNVYKYLFLLPALELNMQNVTEEIIADCCWRNENILKDHLTVLDRLPR